MLTERNLREALRACFDPELGLNIVDLGLVLGIDLAEDHAAPGSGIPGVPARQRLSLTLLIASHDEAYRAQLHAIVSNRLAGMPELSRSVIQITDDPPWTSAQITPEGRRDLQIKLEAKPLFAILNNRLR